MDTAIGERQKIIVVGNGMVGYKFCEKWIAKEGIHEQYELTVFGEEKYLGYDRVQLSAYFSGQTVEDLTLAPFSWYEENDIKLYLNERVSHIDRAAKIIQTDKAKELSYDILVLATGSSPFVPPLPGVDKKGVFLYRTINDLKDIEAYGADSKTAAVMGGGLLGLEAAKALVDMNLETHVVEFASRLMPRQLDDAGSECLQSKIEDLGVSIHLNKNTDHVIGEDALTGLKFKDETELNVDMLVISAGIRPRDDLARESGLEVGERGGIVVDSAMKTSDDAIYAIGECALYEGMIYGLVAPGYQMAEVAVEQILQGSKEFLGADMSTKLKLLGVEVGSFGDPFECGDHVSSIVVSNEQHGVYKKLVVNKETQVLLGGILVGDTSEYGQLLQLVQLGSILPEQPESLLIKAIASDHDEHHIDAMPDEAQVCSCESVSKACITSALKDEGVSDLAGIKSCTKAGTGCGGCVPLVTDILHRHKELEGETVRKVLCEHFDHTRQELVSLIKEGAFKSFVDVLAAHGTGSGCEICKPAVASILASYFNEFVMKHQAVQDSNDFYMANIQKNGTYSVVPRVPGGELTPQQLIRMGEVALEYNLYTKVTGGQRIDLFGAHVEDLPAIWEKLIEVGLESGHAYAKSLRTVKSCVGSTWCRYGVQDSVGLAIKIENRYKGLRAPHKIKAAVSGCIRECAEARGKDFGIIATENGYNLYLGGNGGMNPKHAILFAENIDEETVIRYVDRFLMYYIRTADRLMRTAAWLEQLEGGIEALKRVVIEDSLGICEDLDAEMAYFVNTYKCEWTATLEDPETMKKFRSFVNSEDKDPTIAFEQERGQIKPLLKNI